MIEKEWLTCVGVEIDEEDKKEGREEAAELEVVEEVEYEEEEEVDIFSFSEFCSDTNSEIWMRLNELLYYCMCNQYIYTKG